MRPAYITITRRANSAITPRSCEISSTAMPSSARSSRSNSSTWAWIVTSSAVVGSSAISSRGRQAIAIAIITRWRIPPDSRCGYSSTRRLASGIRTRSSNSIARWRACGRDRPWCSRSVSEIWSQIVSTGFSDDIGSWNTIAMSRPRMRRSSASSASSKSWPAWTMRPLTMRELPLACSRSIDSAVTLLPLPDSPTMPRQSPSAMSNETSSIAVIQPRSVRNWTVRSWIETSAVIRRLSAAGRARRASRRRAGSGRARPG